MHVDEYAFGHITIDGVQYAHDVVIDRGRIRKRRKGPSKKRREEFGHTPLTADEDVPWKARRLWIGTGAEGMLPVAEDLRREAHERKVEILVRTTAEVVELINAGLPPETNVILHVTC